MMHFKSIEDIKTAQVEDLLKVQGVTRTVAQSIYAFFH